MSSDGGAVMKELLAQCAGWNDCVTRMIQLVLGEVVKHRRQEDDRSGPAFQERGLQHIDRCRCLRSRLMISLE